MLVLATALKLKEMRNTNTTKAKEDPKAHDETNLLTSTPIKQQIHPMNM